MRVLREIFKSYKRGFVSASLLLRVQMVMTWIWIVVIFISLIADFELPVWFWVIFLVTILIGVAKQSWEMRQFEKKWKRETREHWEQMDPELRARLLDVDEVRKIYKGDVGEK